MFIWSDDPHWWAHYINGTILTLEVVNQDSGLPLWNAGRQQLQEVAKKCQIVARASCQWKHPWGFWFYPKFQKLQKCGQLGL